MDYLDTNPCLLSAFIGIWEDMTRRKDEANKGGRWVPMISGERDNGVFKAWVNRSILDAYYRWNGPRAMSQMEQDQDTEY